MTECIYCRTTCNDGEMPCPDRNAAESCAWFTGSDRRALQHSGEPVGELSFPEEASKEADGGHINPSPAGEVEKVIEATVSALKGASVTGSGGYLFINVAAFKDLVRPALTTYAEDNERLKRDLDGAHKAADWNMQVVAERDAEIERLRAERDEANSYRHQLYEALRQSNENYTALRDASQAQAEEMRKALEELARFADQRSEEWFAKSNEADTSYAESDRLAAKSDAADEIADAIRTALTRSNKDDRHGEV